MSALDEFQKAITQEAADLIAAAPAGDQASARYRMGEVLGHPRKGPPPPPRQLAPRETLVEQLFLGFAEILRCVESLRNIGVYVRRFPYRHTAVSEASYLRYHVEGYLGELYILQQRMDRYLTVIERRYRSDSRAAEVAKACTVIRAHLKTALAGMIDARGGHVHEKRFDDEDLARLTLFEILRGQGDEYERAYNAIYREVRKAKREWIEEATGCVERLLDDYFGILTKLLFGRTGRLRAPSVMFRK